MATLENTRCIEGYTTLLFLGIPLLGDRDWPILLHSPNIYMNVILL